MHNIYRDGFTIVRDGQEIKLTAEEIRDISYGIDEANGQGSIEYFIESFWEPDEEETKMIAEAEKLLEDRHACYEIWSDYWDDITYDTGSAEFEAVYNYIKNRMKGDN